MWKVDKLFVLSAALFDINFRITTWLCLNFSSILVVLPIRVVSFSLQQPFCTYLYCILFFFSLSALHPEPQMIFPGFIVSQREKWDRCALTQYTYGWTQVTDWSDLFINAANSSWEITWSVWTVVLKIGESQKYLTQKYSHRLQVWKVFSRTTGRKETSIYPWKKASITGCKHW